MDDTRAEMKYLVVLASGLADEPVEGLEGRTPVEAAETPVLDEMARHGRLAAVTTLPEDLPASEEVALFSILGYDPHDGFCGEAGLAAADLLSSMPAGQMAFVHNLATVGDETMLDCAAGHIPPKEAEALLTALAEALDTGTVQFCVGQGFRGLTVMGLSAVPPPQCLPPEEALNRPIEACLPRGEGAEELCRLIAASREIFSEHEINTVRADLGENPADILWPWGGGRPPELPAFESRYGLQATMIADTAAARGFGKATGMAVIEAADSSARGEGDYERSAQRATDALSLCDVAIVHVSAPGEASLDGDARRKVEVVQEIDRQLLGPLFRYAAENELVRLLFSPTHLASVSRRRRMHAPVSAVMFGPGLEALRGGTYSEIAVDRAEIVVKRGHELLEYFLRT